MPLTPRQRAAFIFVDGKRNLDELLAATAGMGVTQADIEQLLVLGLIVELLQSRPSKLSEPVPAPKSTRTPQERYRDAYLVATQITSSLGLRGFRLNLAVEAAGSFEQLVELAPKIRQAVTPEKFAALDAALHG